jgi:HK97 gp10 family phage protein
MNVEFKVTGKEVVLKNLQRISSQDKNKIRDAVNESAMNIQLEAKQLCPVGGKHTAGGLRASINIKKFLDGMAATIGPRLGKLTKGKGFNYAFAVEYGTKPHFPPPDALEDWVENKWQSSISPWGMRLGQIRRTRTTKASRKSAEISAAAFMLARSISKHGTRPHPFLTPAFEHEAPRFISNLKEALK